MSALLKTAYRVQLANDAEAALQRLRRGAPPDLKLLDIMMRSLDGHQLLVALKVGWNHLERLIILLMAMSAAEKEERGLAVAAGDGIAHPIDLAVGLAQDRKPLRLKTATDHEHDRRGLLQSQRAFSTPMATMLSATTVGSSQGTAAGGGTISPASAALRAHSSRLAPCWARTAMRAHRRNASKPMALATAGGCQPYSGRGSGG